MVRSVIMGVTALLMAVLVPAYLCEPAAVSAREPYLLIVKQDAQQTDGELCIDLKTEQGIQNIALEEYLVGVVLSEMPASFELEALKAQAVAARTFTLRQLAGGKHSDCDLCSDSRCCQAWSSRETMEDKLGEAFLPYWTKAEIAVRETEGEAIYYGDALIDAVYFSCSGGMTEDAAAVWGSDVPYLQSVESPGEEAAGPFSSSVAVPLDQFQQKILNANADAAFSGPPAGWFGDVDKSSGGGVRTMVIGGVSFTGTELRSLFGLRSAYFTVSITDQEIVFSVLGYGHRVGMSQYGANAMAKAGNGYTEILKHYYSGVEIKKHP